MNLEEQVISANNIENEQDDTLVGTNLASIDYYSSQLPFLNEFKSSSSWITQSQGTWNTEEEDLLDLDSEGWVRSLPSSEEGAEFTSVSTLLFRDHNSYLPGNYVVLYEGEGEIEYEFDAEKNEALSTPGRDVIEVDPSGSGILLTITETDPDEMGDYIRDIKVVHEDLEPIAATETFNPEFLEKIELFDTLRFMDWMETNGSTQENWEDRPKPEDARYSESGVPLEVMVELANQTDTDPWFNIPHLATDEYVENFAQYVSENLDPDLDVYVEYSNEVWNGLYEQSKWAQQQAEQEWPDSNLNRHDFYSKRTTEVVKIWEEAFASDSERVVGVISAQNGNIAIGERVLDYNWSEDPNLSHSETGIDAIAINSYFGRYIGKAENEAEVETWLEEPDGGLDNLFQEVTEGGVLSDTYEEGGALGELRDSIKQYTELAEEEDLLLLGYEGGQHLVGVNSVQNNQDLSELFIEANSDPRMGEVYEDFLSIWSDAGGDLFVHYNDIRVPSKTGSWGSLESVYQDGSPKYNALTGYDPLAEMIEVPILIEEPIMTEDSVLV